MSIIEGLYPSVYGHKTNDVRHGILSSVRFKGKKRRLKVNFIVKTAFILVLLILISTVSIRVGTTASLPMGIRLSWIQDATNTTMTIMWETTSSGNPNEVQYGLTSACELETETGFSFADSWGVYYNHQVELTGLSPNTKYYYKVSGDSGGWSAVHEFTTAFDSAINWTFLVAGDSRTNYDDWTSVAQTMATNSEARLLFFGGDILTDFDTQSEWHEWMLPAEQLIANVPFITNKGNHEDDITGDPWDNYLNTFAFPSNEEYFSFDYGNAHFIVLNSEDSYDSAQKLWLENDLQAVANNPSDPWIFVSYHKPSYGSGGHDSSLSTRSNFVPLLRDYGADLVFTGHNHFYQRTYPLDCTDIDNPVITDYDKDFYHYPDPIFATVGRAGAPSTSPSNSPGWFVEDRMSSSLHYMKMDIYTNGSLHATTRYTDNSIFDDFWIVKNGTPPVPITQTITLISAGDEWRYSETDPQPPATPSWSELGFDESSWLTGAAPLGFGDSVVYGTVLNDNDGSYYFRNTFNLESSTEIVSASLNVASDNYANVYLNGILVDDDSGANHEFSYWNRYVSVPPSIFQSGENTVAVFVYNTAGSSDVYMDLELNVTITNNNSLSLISGWNFISIPLIQTDQNPIDVLESIQGHYDAIQFYNNLDSKDPWKHYTVEKCFGNDISQLNEAMGFWIHITQPGITNFIYNGTKPTSNLTIALYPGWNQVGYPSRTSYDRTEGLNNLTFGQEVDLIQYYDAQTQTWYDMGVNDYFVKGRGYWIHAKTECEWEVPL
ncbi:MAG: metallophosphoesterase family protein [Thermoplasmata archaeon]|nr:MAG: metallophosphoesterase family protein [Thermoplasmata archaeon]